MSNYSLDDIYRLLDERLPQPQPRKDMNIIVHSPFGRQEDKTEAPANLGDLPIRPQLGDRVRASFSMSPEDSTILTFRHVEIGDFDSAVLGAAWRFDSGAAARESGWTIHEFLDRADSVPEPPVDCEVFLDDEGDLWRHVNDSWEYMPHDRYYGWIKSLENWGVIYRHNPMKVATQEDLDRFGVDSKGNKIVREPQDVFSAVVAGPDHRRSVYYRTPDLRWACWVHEENRGFFTSSTLKWDNLISPRMATDEERDSGETDE